MQTIFSVNGNVVTSSTGYRLNVPDFIEIVENPDADEFKASYWSTEKEAKYGFIFCIGDSFSRFTFLIQKLTDIRNNPDSRAVAPVEQGQCYPRLEDQ